jgi:hypothetical protein
MVKGGRKSKGWFIYTRQMVVDHMGDGFKILEGDKRLFSHNKIGNVFWWSLGCGMKRW